MGGKTERIKFFGSETDFLRFISENKKGLDELVINYEVLGDSNSDVFDARFCVAVSGKDAFLAGQQYKIRNFNEEFLKNYLEDKQKDYIGFFKDKGLDLVVSAKRLPYLPDHLKIDPRN